MSRTNVYRDGRVYVCSQECSTCIFRKGNLMQLQSGRVRQMVDECRENDGVIPCHKTLDGDHAICRGFFDRHKQNITGLRMAVALDVVEEMDPE